MKILTVAAHSDDNQIGCGGILLQLIERGDKVKALFTSGYKRESIPASLQVLGIKDFEDLDLEFERQYKHMDMLIKKVEDVFETFNPDMVFTHWPENDLMSDHAITGRVVRDISLARGLGWQGRIYFFEINHCCQGFRPDLYFQVTPAHWERKINSIKALSTYTPEHRAAMIQQTTTKARMRGFESRTEYAECLARFSPKSVPVSIL